MVAANLIKLSSNRTKLLTDENPITCISLMSFSLQPSSWAKFIPNESYIKRAVFSINLMGHGFICSPIDGISVALQPQCRDAGTCNNAEPCKAGKSSHQGIHSVCEYQCASHLEWEFVVVYLRPLAIYHGENPPELCEMWFSYWLKQFKTFKLVRICVTC